MPDRVNADTSGVRPTTARQDTQRAERTAQEAQRAEEARANDAANQADRVEISAEGRARAERPTSAGPPQGAERGAAASAQSA